MLQFWLGKGMGVRDEGRFEGMEYFCMENKRNIEIGIDK